MTTAADLATLNADLASAYSHSGSATTLLGEGNVRAAEVHMSAVAFALAGAASAAVALNADLNPPTPPPVNPPPVTTKPPLSMYTGSNDLAGAQALAAQLGVVAEGVSIYCNGQSWATIDGSGPWAESDAGSEPLFLSVNLCPGGANLAQVPANAAGFTTLAKSLKAGIVVRPGWEWDGNWFPWGIGKGGSAPSSNTVAQLVAAYRVVVAAMRAGNATLKFDWCSNAGTSTLAQLQIAYPGDDVVDFIGCDIYDQGSQAANVAAITPTIQMAAAHNKPVSFGEWGAAGNGTDDAAYIDLMALVILNPTQAAKQFGWPAYTVAYSSLFTDASNNITNKPKMIAEFAKAFAGGAS